MTKLNYVPDPRAAELLVGALADESEAIRLQAVHALRKVGDRRAVDALNALSADRNRRVRVAASIAIRKLCACSSADDHVR